MTGYIKAEEVDERIAALAKEFESDVIFDMCDITIERVLEILVEGGHIDLPDWTPRW